jgi:hypothetical protein
VKRRSAETSLYACSSNFRFLRLSIPQSPSRILAPGYTICVIMGDMKSVFNEGG